MAASGVAAILGTSEELTVVGIRNSATTLGDAIQALRPDIVLCDVRMPEVDGVEAATRHARQPDAPRFLMMTAFDEEGRVLDAINAGAVGFLLKHDDPRWILDAVLAIKNGGSAYSPRAAAQLTEWIQNSRSSAAQRAAIEKMKLLTDRERQFAIALVTDGASDADLAARFFVAETTVKSALGAIRTKWGVRSRTEIAVIVAQSGLA